MRLCGLVHRIYALLSSRYRCVATVAALPGLAFHRGGETIELLVEPSQLGQDLCFGQLDFGRRGMRVLAKVVG